MYPLRQSCSSPKIILGDISSPKYLILLLEKINLAKRYREKIFFVADRDGNRDIFQILEMKNEF